MYESLKKKFSPDPIKNFYSYKNNYKNNAYLVVLMIIIQIY